MKNFNLELNERASIMNVAHGQAPNLFLKELRKVMENMMDDTTDEDETRYITLKFAVIPCIDNSPQAKLRKDRIKNMRIAVQSSSKLAKSTTNPSVTFIDFDDEGMPRPMKFDPSQIDIFDQMEVKKNLLKGVVNE